MGSAYFIVTEQDIDGYSAMDIEGKMLAKADMALDKAGFYSAAGLKPLHFFCGDDVSDLLADFDEEVDVGEGGEQWFEPDDGLATVQALSAHLQANPGVVPHQDMAVDDLAIFAKVLAACGAQGSKWYLSIDF